MNISQLIAEIAPLYNKYLADGDTFSGTEALEIMWDVGEILERYIKSSKLPPHRLYREVYGKAEGAQNVTQKSYITREFMGRCYRIRNIFANKADIRRILPTLSKFNLFRESMPFFDNPKYKLHGQEYDKLIVLLNSNAPYAQIRKSITSLQAEKIGRRNPRTQKLSQFDAAKASFINIYNKVFGLISAKDYTPVDQLVQVLGKEVMLALARNISALTKDGLKFTSQQMPTKGDPEWIEFIEIVAKFASEPNEMNRRRFRRIIPPERIARLADMLYAILAPDTYKDFR